MVSVLVMPMEVRNVVPKNSLLVQPLLQSCLPIVVPLTNAKVSPLLLVLASPTARDTQRLSLLA
jgi:hypothetical protein